MINRLIMLATGVLMVPAAATADQGQAGTPQPQAQAPVPDAAHRNAPGDRRSTAAKHEGAMSATPREGPADAAAKPPAPDMKPQPR